MSSYMDDFQPDYDPSIEAESSMGEPAKPYSPEELKEMNFRGGHPYDRQGNAPDIIRLYATAQYIRDLEAQVVKYRTIHVLCGGCGRTYTYLRDAEKTGEEHECRATREGKQQIQRMKHDE